MESKVDYGASGMTICEAMIDNANRFPDKDNRPNFIFWNGLHVKTGDRWQVPELGRVRIKILSHKKEVEQGIDLRVIKGAVILAGGEEVSLLRTWADERYEAVVEYPYFSKSGEMYITNVYKVVLPNGITREEKWTGNAGFLVESVSSKERIYRCSYGDAEAPDFGSLVFGVTIIPGPCSPTKSSS